MTTHFHPATGTDYRTPIYITRDGRPRYAIGGASEPAGVDPAPPAPPADPANPPAPSVTPPTPPAPPTSDPAPPADDKLPEDRDALVKMIGDLRKENASSRTTAKQQAADEAKQELAQSIGKALGLVKDDEPVDPAELAKKVEQSQKGERTAQIHLAVFKTAGAHKGDPAALLDSNSFLAKLSDLDPSATDFDTKVSEAIKVAVEANPKLVAGPVPPSSSSTDHSTPPGGDTPRKPMSLSDAAASHYGT